MEQKDFKNFQLDGCWYTSMPPPNQLNVDQCLNNAEWSFEENKIFENALAEQIEVVGSDTFFQNLVTMIPHKSMHDIKIHFEALVEDIEMIELDLVTIPDYKMRENTRPLITELMAETNVQNQKRSSSIETNRGSSSHRHRGQPWTEEEHRLFLMGLDNYGKGNWRKISRYYVTSKTPTQIASHAQKYFRRQTSTTPMNRRRPSIHDIQTVANVTYHGHYMALPMFTSNLQLASAPTQMFLQGTTAFTDNSMNVTGTNLQQNHIIIVPDGHVNSGPCMPSSTMNIQQQWGAHACLRQL